MADQAKPTQDEAPLLPAFFQPLLEASYASADVERIIAGCQTQRAVTLRTNTLKTTRDQVAQALNHAGISWSPVAWYPDAFVITNAREKDLWALPLYQQGEVYLQSLSSMLPPLAMDLQPGLDVLDMCAAPGGKTCQMAALSQGVCHITACEMQPSRADKLEHNLQVQGATNVTVMRADSRTLDDFFRFDRILLDAPCSGSGTLNVNDPKMPQRFTPALVEKSVKSQTALINKALRLLKPGGELLYSTCSVLKRENEDVVQAALNLANNGGLVPAHAATASFGPSKSGKGKHKGKAKASKPVHVDPIGTFELAPMQILGQDLSATLPLLPSTLEGSVTVCPTDQFEGFFMARIKRLA